MDPDELQQALAGTMQGQPPGVDPKRLALLGLIGALSGNKQLAQGGEAVSGYAQQQQQMQMQAPLHAAQAQHAAAQAAELRQKVQNEGPQEALGGQSPSVFERLTKRSEVPKFSVNPATGGLYNARTGKSVEGGGGGGGLPGLTPQALDQIAEQFHTTGQLPPTGMGAAGLLMRKAIINRAAELHPDANLAGNKAGFKADSGSLTKAQAQADSIEAFENTALKNLDNFLQIGKQISDTGIPIANKPIRAIADSLGGSPAQAQFNAARHVAIQEISKVLGGAVSGGAVTEGQRHEVEGLMRGDATLDQLNAVAQTLRQDMANRKASVSAQIGAIRGRMGGQPAAPAAAEGPKRRKYNPATGALE